MDSLTVRRAEPRDYDPLARMFHALWPDASLEQHAAELPSLIAGTWPGILPGALFVAETSAGRLAGFAEVDLRSHADGCDVARPVGFLEGWYVDPDHRRRQVGARLLAAAEQWARDQGAVEMASDTWLDHLESQRAHEALGFEVVDRCVHYRKRL